MRHLIIILILTMAFYNVKCQNKKYSFGIEPFYSHVELSKGNLKFIDSHKGKSFGFGILVERRIIDNLSINTGLYYVIGKSESSSSFDLNTYCPDLDEIVDVNIKMDLSAKSDLLRIPIKINYYYHLLYFSGGLLVDYNIKSDIVEYSIEERPSHDCIDIGEPYIINEKKLHYALAFNFGVNLDLINKFKVVPNMTFNLHLNTDKNKDFTSDGMINSYDIGLGLKFIY